VSEVVTVTDPDYSPRYVRGVVALLVTAVGFEFFHRQLLAIAVEPIRAELGFSDTQMGALVTGFAVAYAACVLVLGRLADAGSRRTIYALSIAVWSAGTALGGVVSGFASFLLTRLVVGLGQAGAGATNGPLVADYVPPARRATTMGVVAMGATLGVFLALGLGGWGIAAFGWRATFAVGGALGLFFAVGFRLAVHEPPRGWSEARTHEARERPGLAEVVRTIAGLRTFRHMVAGAILASMALFASAQWGPAFLQRTHGLSLQAAGIAAGGIAVLATFGAIAGGVLSDRMWAKNARGVLLLPAACCGAAFPLSLGAYFWPALGGAIALLAAASVLALVHSPPVSAVTQALAPLRMRGMISAVLNSLLTLFGLGAGPLLTGWVSDLVSAGGGDGLRTGLAGVSVLYLWSAIHFVLAARTLPAELASSGGAGGAG
jgi:predicted MFS family arabinose efflux permease